MTTTIDCITMTGRSQLEGTEVSDPYAGANDTGHLWRFFGPDGRLVVRRETGRNGRGDPIVALADREPEWVAL